MFPIVVALILNMDETLNQVHIRANACQWIDKPKFVVRSLFYPESKNPTTGNR